jgi:hypothetical protein
MLKMSPCLRIFIETGGEYPYLRHWTEISGQLEILAPLFVEKESAVSISVDDIITGPNKVSSEFTV